MTRFELTEGSNDPDPSLFYIIDLLDILDIYLTNTDIRKNLNRDYTSKISVMTSFFDGEFYRKCSVSNHSNKYIFMSLYADEINLINPIGKHVIF